MAGIDLPRGQLIRGRSIVPLLKGQSDTWDNDFYAEYSTHHQSRTQMRMYRTPDWKLVRDLKNPTRDELFNLRDDPGESTNLIRSEQADIVAVRDRLQQRLSERMRQNGDPALATKPPSP